MGRQCTRQEMVVSLDVEGAVVRLLKKHMYTLNLGLSSCGAPGLKDDV